MDAQKEIRSTISDFFEKLSFPTTSVEVVPVPHSLKEHTLLYCVTVSDPRSLIGKHGEVLACINHLVKKIINKKQVQYMRKDKALEENLIIDIDGYQQKRIEEIQSVAHMLAERAKFFASTISTDPMNSFERRIVHEFLSEREYIKTESVGEGEQRRIIISYTSQ
ncbi:MAG: hypothetical protein MUD00_00720 [Candidatus Pacebacteria bacterium]|jgi:spoIIIJ-associated protein|nr:hypothetical protein [Candidatus Paceibacterota bacterium]